MIYILNTELSFENAMSRKCVRVLQIYKHNNVMKIEIVTDT
jgi:aspartate carbamoyltransferase catalytic subunit